MSAVVRDFEGKCFPPSANFPVLPREAVFVVSSRIQMNVEGLGFF